MSGPFHNNAWRNPQGKGIDDEGAASNMCADKIPFGVDLVSSDVSLVCGNPDFIVDACQFAYLFHIPVHGLVSQVGQGLSITEGYILILLKVVVLDVTLAEIVGIWMPDIRCLYIAITSDGVGIFSLIS